MARRLSWYALSSSSPANAIFSARVGQRVGQRDAAGRAGERQQRRAAARRRGARCRSGPGAGADDRHGDDRQQRRRLGLVLAQAEEDHQRRHEQHAAADAEHPGDHAAGDADRDRADHGSTSSTALATSTPRTAARSPVGQTRCCSQVPNSTPPTAGTPTSRPVEHVRRCRRAPWTPAAKAAMKTIAASDVAVAARSLVAEPEHQQRHDHAAAADAEQPAEQRPPRCRSPPACERASGPALASMLAANGRPPCAPY